MPRARDALFGAVCGTCLHFEKMKPAPKPARSRNPSAPRRLDLPTAKELVTLMTALAAVLTALAHLLR